MTEVPTLLDRYCTCKTLCVWIPMDPPNLVWSVPPRAFQAYCPTCKIIVNEYYEKNEHNALMLTPQVSFAIFKENENLNAEIAALKDTITSLRVHLAVIREYVKDKVSFALKESEK